MPEQKSLLIEAETVGDEEFVAECSYRGKKVGEVKARLHEGTSRLVLPLDELHLWEEGKGRLYDLNITYGKDSVKSYFGMRTAGFDKKNFLL